MEWRPVMTAPPARCAACRPAGRAPEAALGAAIPPLAHGEPAALQRRRRSAAASSCPSRWSARSGSITSKIRFPNSRNSSGPCTRALSSNTVRPGGGPRPTPWWASSSSAWVITRSCSVLTRPAARVCRLASSRRPARPPTAARPPASCRDNRWVPDNHPAVDVAPRAPGRSRLAAAATTRMTSSSAWARTDSPSSIPPRRSLAFSHRPDAGTVGKLIGTGCTRDRRKFGTDPAAPSAGDPPPSPPLLPAISRSRSHTAAHFNESSPDTFVRVFDTCGESSAHPARLVSSGAPGTIVTGQSARRATCSAVEVTALCRSPATL